MKNLRGLYVVFLIGLLGGIVVGELFFVIRIVLECEVVLIVFNWDFGIFFVFIVCE